MNDISLKEAWETGPGPRSKKEYIILYIKGFLMGIADLIPGVSGGTIAFITGIYDTLLDAAASIDKTFIKHVLKFEIKKAIAHLHFRFIIPLVLGMFTAMITLARVMHYLINEQPIPTWALFFGLIGASIIVIWNKLDDHFSPVNLLIISIGAIFAYIMVSLIPVDTPDALWFIYLCGIIGITAMILPGLSGSFLLLILGKYEYITAALKNPFAEGAPLILVIFIMGTATGLMSFSKILNFFMKNYRVKTMAFLTGILIGSMKKVWPWKEVLESKIVRGKTKIIREMNIMPTEFNNEVLVAIALMLIGFIFVLVLEKKSSN